MTDRIALSSKWMVMLMMLAIAIDGAKGPVGDSVAQVVKVALQDAIHHEEPRIRLITLVIVLFIMND